MISIPIPDCLSPFDFVSLLYDEHGSRLGAGSITMIGQNVCMYDPQIIWSLLIANPVVVVLEIFDTRDTGIPSVMQSN